MRGAIGGRARQTARRVLRRAPEPLSLAMPSGLLQWRRQGSEPCVAGTSADATSLRVAVVIPPFRRGSGGHATIASLVRELDRLGHRCSLWLADDEQRHRGQTPEELDASFRAFFGELRAPVHHGFGEWEGTDVALATGWQTVYRTLLLGGCRSRAYLVQDHEPEFYPTSAEALWAADSYRQGLHCIAASPWLAALLRERYGASASHFDLGVEHEVYRPSDARRRKDLVVFYARALTPRRAVPLGLLALTELARRRPQVEIGLFGESRPLPARFKLTDMGVLAERDLARLYGEATVGIVLSLTNPSRLHAEMLACGLPCVDLDTPGMRATFGADGPIELAEPDPVDIADVLERLLDDPARRKRNAEAGRQLADCRSWPTAARQVQNGLRSALDVSA